MSKLKVSVVMCCYNEHRFIREAIDSVLSQTFKDFEFIIWNDGSTDDTEKIIKSYSDLRIRYFYHENTGLGEALRLACQEARGEYIARIDCDDVCMPDRFEKQVLFLDSHSDYVLCSTGVYYMDIDGKVFGRRFPATEDTIIRRRLAAITHPATMFRTDAYKKCGGYYPLRSAQDKILWSRMVKLGKVVNLSEALIKYRMVPDSITHVLDYNSAYGKMIELIRKKMCKDDGYNEEDVKLHNSIYVLAKKSSVKNKVLGYKKSVEEKLYDILSPLFGEESAVNILYLFKNTYLRLYLSLKH